jgi:chorismate mutase
VIEEARAKIDALDAKLVATINARIRTVAELHRWKAENGVAMVDPGREAALVQRLQELNAGPLSDEGVEELIAFVLDLVKREVAACVR